MTWRSRASILGIGFYLVTGPLAAQQGPIEDAWTFLRSGQRGKAVALLQEIIRQHPSNPDARLLLGSIWTEEGRRDDAVTELTEAVRLRPGSAEAQNALGEAYLKFDEPESARAPLERAVKLQPGFSAALVNLGAALLRLGEPVAAGSYLDRGIAVLKGAAEGAYPLYLRAKIHMDRGRAEEAAADLNRAVKLRPDFPEAWSDLGEARRTLGDDSGALAALQRAVALAPDDAIAQYRLGSELLAQGKAHDSLEHFQEAVRIDPSDQSALNGLQRALRAADNAQAADQVKDKLAALFRAKNAEDRNSVEAIRLNNEGAALEKGGDLRGAIQKYRDALALCPDHTGIRTNLAAALLHTGQWSEGVSQLREVLRREPGNGKVRAALNEALSHPPPLR